MQLTACTGLSDKDPCTIAATDDGLCDQNVCLDKRCGDGIRTDNELCDKTDLGSGDCTDFGYYRSKQPLCNDACNYDVTSCLDAGYCGDGHVDEPIEICEGNTRPAKAECIDYGYGAGVLGCGACGPAFDRCERFGWNVVTVPGSGGAIGDVHGLSATDVYAVGGSELFHFNGTAWTNVAINANTCGTYTTQFTAVWEAAPDVVFAANFDGTVIRIDHGACTKWTVFAGERPFDLTGTSPTDVWVTTTVTYGIAHFDGTQWTQQLLSGGSTIKAIQIFAPSTTDAFAVVTATDKVARFQGSSWSTPVTIANLSYPRVVFGKSANDYFIGGSNTNTATLVHWTGSSYVPVNGLAPFVAGTTSFITNGVIIGTRLVIGVYTYNGTTGIESDLLLEYDGTSWTDLRMPGNTSGLLWATPDGQSFASAGIPNQMFWLPRNLRSDFLPFFTANSPQVAAQSPTDAYVAAPQNGLYHWNGFNWTSVAASAFDVTFAPTGEPYASDLGGLRYLTGTWQNDASAGLGTAVSALAANDVWMIDGNHTLKHWTGPGVTAAVTIPGADTAVDVWAAASNAVFVTDTGGAVRKYDGVGWSVLPTVPASTPTNKTLNAVWGRAPNDFYVAGFAKLFHFDGSVWTPIPLPANTGVSGLWGGPNDNDLFIAAEEHGLLYWNGTELSPIDDGTPFVVYSVAGAGDAVFYTDSNRSAHELVRVGRWH